MEENQQQQDQGSQTENQASPKTTWQVITYKDRQQPKLVGTFDSEEEANHKRDEVVEQTVDTPGAPDYIEVKPVEIAADK